MNAARKKHGLLAALGLSLSLLGCEAEKISAPPPRPVRVQVAAAPQAPPALRFSATIEASRKVSLAFETGGTFAEILQVPGEEGPRTVEAGDVVKAGTLLARLDALPASERLHQAEAQRGEAEAQAQKTRQDLARAEALFAQQALTLPELEGARAAAEAARQRVAAATAQQALARRGRQDTRLEAPFQGTLLRRGAELGALAAPGVPYFELADTQSLKAVFGVPDTVVGRLVPGQSLSVFAQPLAGASFEGRLRTISPSADPQSRVFAVEVEIPNPGDRLKIGMIVSVEVPQARNSEAQLESKAEQGAAVAVPLAAVVRAQKSEGYAVFVLEGEGMHLKARERAVQVGEIFGHEVSLLQGVGVGDRVVVAGATLLADGEAVVVIP